MDHSYLSSKELAPKVWKNLDFWAFLGFLGVWTWNGHVLGGRSSGRFNAWAEILSWVKFKVYDEKGMRIGPWQGGVIGHQSGLQSSMKWDIWACEETMFLGFENEMHDHITSLQEGAAHLVIFIKFIFCFKEFCHLISFLV